MKEEISPDPEVIACHEAGHLVVARYCGRRVKKVCLELIDGKRGCFYEPAGEHWTDYDEFLCLLAGPRAQLALCPSSVEEQKLARLRERIIQPKELRFEIPAIYDYTGWEHDVRPVYEMLMLPDAPVAGLPGIVTRREALNRAEAGLLHAIVDREIVTAVRHVADFLFKHRNVQGDEATEAVVQSGILELPLLGRLLKW